MEDKGREMNGGIGKVENGDKWGRWEEKERSGERVYCDTAVRSIHQQAGVVNVWRVTCGRTGVDTEVDIFKTILNLRQQRSGFVQTPLQYKFIYVAVKRFVELQKNPPPSPSSPSVSFVMPETLTTVCKNLQVLQIFA